MESLERSPTSSSGGMSRMKSISKWDDGFKVKIISLIQERDRRENKGFAELFKNHERLFDNWAAVRSENLRLSLQIERGLSGTGGGVSEEREKQLEHKILALQEELTELHRRRGENATQVLALSAKLTEREEELEINRNACAKAVAEKADLDDQFKALQSHNQQIEATNELLRDEHQALHLAYTSLEEKHRKLTFENQELLQRYIEIKAKHADIMNQENENFVKQRQAKVRKELEEAAAEVKTVVLNSTLNNSPPNSSDIPYLSSLGYSTTLPTTSSNKYEAHESDVNAVRWLPNGRQLITAGQDRRVKVWEPTKSGVELRYTLNGSNGSILCLDIDSTGSHVIASSSDFACRIWSLNDQRMRHTLTGHGSKVNSARFMPDLNRAVSGSYDRTLKLWDLNKGSCITTFFGGSSCHDLVTLSDGTSLISAHFDRKIRFWDSRSKSDSPNQQVLLQGRLTSLDISSNENFLLASVREQEDAITLLDLRMNSVVGDYRAEGFRVSSDLSRAVFSPDAQFIASGSSDGSVYIWNVMENKFERCLKDHTSSVVCVHWHPQGISIASGDRSKNVVIWVP